MTAPAHPPGWVPAVGTGPGAGAPAAGPATPAFRPTAVTLPPTAQELAGSTRVHLRPTGIAWALLALAGLSALLWLGTDAAPQLAIAVALLAAVVIDALTARASLGRLELRLHGPSDVTAGEPTEWLVRLEGARRPVRLRPALLPRPQQLLLQDALPGRVTMPPFVVGVVHHLVFDASVVGPVGLVEAGRRFRVSPTGPVFVGPRPVPAEVEWPTPRAVGFGLSEVAPLGDELFRSVRPYLRGDERRRIHWKATAHHGELMVRESDGTGVVALQVVVDLGAPGPGADRVAGQAASLAAEALRKGWRVQLVTLHARPVAPGIATLGSPFGAPPRFTLGPPVPMEHRARRVATTQDVSHQLATAGFGPRMIPRWPGITCVVAPGGVEWP